MANSLLNQPWVGFRPEPQNDLGLLMPGGPSGKDRFPKATDAVRNRNRDLATLKRHQAKHPDIVRCVDALSDCADGESCWRPYCHVCMRQVSLWAGGEMIRLFRPLQPDLKAVTLVHAADIQPAGQLAKINPRQMNDRLRRRLGTLFLDNCVAMGGFQVEWRADGWVPHYHLAMHVSEDDFAKLKELKEYDGKRSVYRARIHDLAEQFSYMVKFVTYHRPATQRGSQRAPAVPLPPKRLAEFVLWLERYKPQQLLFMRGVRRVGRSSALALL